jgi:hypothetical protein
MKIRGIIYKHGSKCPQSQTHLASPCDHCNLSNRVTLVTEVVVYAGLYVTCPLLSPILIKIGIRERYFFLISNIAVHANPSGGTTDILCGNIDRWTNGQTDMTKTNSCFSQLPCERA